MKTPVIGIGIISNELSEMGVFMEDSQPMPATSKKLANTYTIDHHIWSPVYPPKQFRTSQDR